MGHSEIRGNKPYYCRWTALAIFVILLICQPRTLKIYAMYPSDAWLLFCLLLQYLNGHNIIINFKDRFLTKNYGLFIGTLAIIATLIQASYANISLNTNFIFQFYRFLRFLIIFKFCENILFNLSINDVHKFFKLYTVLGVAILIISFLEFYEVGLFKLIMIDLYFDAPKDLLDEYLLNVQRLYGIMGNPNTTAMLLVSTLSYPLLYIFSKESSLLKMIFYISYIFAVVYVLLVMTGSRTAIFISILILFIILISVMRGLQNAFLTISLIIMLSVTGFFLYHRFESEIVLQDRITKVLSGEEFQLSVKGIQHWSGRGELWQDRFRTFNRKGNPVAFLFGLGYTKAYDDYSDNGLISAFLNSGLIGFLLKIFLFYIYFTSGFLKAISNFRKLKIDLTYFTVAISTFVLILWELTADMMQEYKLGQLFYLFLSMALIMNSKEFLTANNEDNS